MKKKNVLKQLSDDQIKKLDIEKCYEYYSSTEDIDIRNKLERRAFHLIKRFDLLQCGKYHNSFGDLLRQKILDRIKKLERQQKSFFVKNIAKSKKVLACQKKKKRTKK